MARPDRVFLTITATAAFVSTLAFTDRPLYRFQDAGLDNLELVLVGTVMEAAVFLLRDPDRHRRRPLVAQVVGRHRPRRHRRRASSSRRPSPTFAGVLVGQAVWGLAYTFTSGATVAWVAGELGDPSREVLTRLFLRASRLGSLAALVAVPSRSSSGSTCRLRVADRHRRRRVDRPRGLARRGDGRDATSQPVPTRPLDVAGDGRVGGGRRAGDPGQPRADVPRRRHVPRRRGQRGVRPLHREVPARPRHAGLAGVVGADLARRRRVHCRRRSASSCRGGSSAATATSTTTASGTGSSA